MYFVSYGITPFVKRIENVVEDDHFVYCMEGNQTYGIPKDTSFLGVFETMGEVKKCLAEEATRRVEDLQKQLSDQLDIIQRVRDMTEVSHDGAYL